MKHSLSHYSIRMAKARLREIEQEVRAICRVFPELGTEASVRNLPSGRAVRAPRTLAATARDYRRLRARGARV